MVHGATGGVGWTEVWTSDFDADGHKDFLIGQMFPGNGVCVNPVRLTLLLFDANGRPVPWIGQTQLPDNPSGKELTFPYLPVRVTDTDKDGRAEFVLEDCARDNRQREKKWVSAVHKAKSNRLDDRPASDRIDGLRSGEFGRQAVRGRQTVIPDNIVFDGSAGRDIYIGDSTASWSALQRLIRDGYPIKWTSAVPDEKWVRVNTDQPTRPARVAVDMLVSASPKTAVTAMPAGSGCVRFVLPGTATLLTRCVSGL